MKSYLEVRKRKGIKSKYLFAYLYKGQYKHVSAHTFRNYLKKILKIYYGHAYNRKIHRAHSFRYGGITSLGSVGIPLEWIRKISGHASQSKVLETYLKITAKDNAGLIKIALQSELKKFA